MERAFGDPAQHLFDIGRGQPDRLHQHRAKREPADNGGRGCRRPTERPEPIGRRFEVPSIRQHSIAAQPVPCHQQGPGHAARCGDRCAGRADRKLAVIRLEAPDESGRQLGYKIDQ